MKKCIPVLLLLFLLGHPSFCEDEEFYIVTGAPVVVGGGMIRHYYDSGNGRVSVKYRNGGVNSDTLFIDKISSYSGDGSKTRETIIVPLRKSGRRKKGRLPIGTHDVTFTARKDGRVSVKETR